MPTVLRSCCALTVIALGCGGEYAPPDAGNGSGEAVRNELAQAGPAEAAEPRNAEDVQPIEAVRKIIYEAGVSLVVDEFSKAADEIPKLVASHGGYLADASVDRTSGDRSTARWVARIPVDEFETFVDELESLGVPEVRRQTAQDVTEQFVDLEARIAAKRQLEERVLKLLEARAGRIEEVLKLEGELARIRGEIERMQGQLRYLDNRTALATVTIDIREREDYRPAQAPTFGGRVGDAWSGSLAALRDVLETLVIVAVALAPWLAVLLVACAPLALVIWRLTKRQRFAPSN